MNTYKLPDSLPFFELIQKFTELEYNYNVEIDILADKDEGWLCEQICKIIKSSAGWVKNYKEYLEVAIAKTGDQSEFVHHPQGEYESEYDDHDGYHTDHEFIYLKRNKDTPSFNTFKTKCTHEYSRSEIPNFNRYIKFGRCNCRVNTISGRVEKIEKGYYSLLTYFLEKLSDLNCVLESKKRKDEESYIIFSSEKNSGAISGLSKHNSFSSFTNLLCLAIDANSISYVKLLIAKGCRVEPENIENHLPLLHALSLPDDTILEYLLQCGVELNKVCGNSKRTPLSWTLSRTTYASRNNSLSKIIKLLNAGADPNIEDKFGLPLAIAAGSFDIFMLLQKYGARVDITNESTKKILESAVDNNASDVIKFICDRHQIPPTFLKKLIYHSIEFGLSRSFLQLVKHEPEFKSEVEKDFEMMSITSYSQALDKKNKRKNGNEPVVPRSIHCPLFESIRMAIFKDRDIEFVFNFMEKHDIKIRYEFEAGSRFDIEEILLIESRNGNFENVEQLVKLGININCRGNGYGVVTTPLHEAQENKHGPDRLILLGADVNLPYDRDGNTPLLYACTRRYVEQATFLLKSGADPTLKNQKGECALDHWNHFSEDERKYIMENYNIDGPTMTNLLKAVFKDCYSTSARFSSSAIPEKINDIIKTYVDNGASLDEEMLELLFNDGEDLSIFEKWYKFSVKKGYEINLNPILLKYVTSTKSRNSSSIYNHIKKLIDLGARIDYKDEKGNSLAYNAHVNNSYVICKELFKFGYFFEDFKDAKKYRRELDFYYQNLQALSTEDYDYYCDHHDHGYWCGPECDETDEEDLCCWNNVWGDGAR